MKISGKKLKSDWMSSKWKSKDISFQKYIYGNNFMFLIELSTKSTMWSYELFLEVTGDSGQDEPKGGGQHIFMDCRMKDKSDWELHSHLPCGGRVAATARVEVRPSTSSSVFSMKFR